LFIYSYTYLTYISKNVYYKKPKFYIIWPSHDENI
jgi:hypothetical protein